MTCRRGADVRPSRGWSGLAAFFLLGASAPLSAQAPTDQVSQERVLAPREEIDKAIADSRFRLGPARLSLGLSILTAYDNNVYGTAENPTGDFRAAVTAGLGLILPVTPGVYFRVGVNPTYTWYAELAERRFFGGQYGASFLVFTNRLTLQGSAGFSKTDVIFSSEEQGRVIQNLGAVQLGAELRLLTRFFVYAGGHVQRFRFTGPGAEASIFDPSTTDRTSQLVGAQLRYRFSDNAWLGAGYEETRAEFVTAPQQYDNSTRAIIGTAYFSLPKFYLNASGGYREGKPIHGSTIPPFSGFTGSGNASYSLFRRLELQAFGGRYLSYGISSPYYVSTRYGGGLNLNIGWRLSLQGFVLAGTDEYATPTPLPGGQLVYRKDDVMNYGGFLNFLFSSQIQLRFAAAESRYNSNVPGNDRSFFRYLVTLGYGLNLLNLIL